MGTCSVKRDRARGARANNNEKTLPRLLIAPMQLVNSFVEMR